MEEAANAETTTPTKPSAEMMRLMFNEASENSILKTGPGPKRSKSSLPFKDTPRGGALARLEELLEETDTEISIQQDISLASSIDSGSVRSPMHSIHATSSVLRDADISKDASGKRKTDAANSAHSERHRVQDISAVSENLSARLGATLEDSEIYEDSPRTTAVRVADEAKRAIDNIFGEIGSDAATPKAEERVAEKVEEAPTALFPDRASSSHATPKVGSIKMVADVDEAARPQDHRRGESVVEEGPTKMVEDVSAKDDDAKNVDEGEADEEDEHRHQTISTPGRMKSWERLNELYSEHRLAESPIFVAVRHATTGNGGNRVRVDVKALISATRLLFERYEERGSIIQGLAEDLKRADRRISAEDMQHAQKSEQLDRLIRQQGDVSSNLRKTVQRLERKLEHANRENEILQKRARRMEREFKQQLRYSVQRCKVQERVAEKLQKRLQTSVKKQNRLRTRGRELLMQQQQSRRSSAASSSKGSAPATPSSVDASILSTPRPRTTVKSNRSRRLYDARDRTPSPKFVTLTPSTSSVRQSPEVLEAVGEIEDQRKRMMRQITSLRRELQEANRRIVRLSRASSSTEEKRSGTGRSGGDDDDIAWEGTMDSSLAGESVREKRLMNQLRRWRREQRKVLESQREWQMQIESERERIVENLKTANARVDAKNRECALLQEELATRPSSTEWADAQREMLRQRRELKLLGSFISESDMRKWRSRSKTTRQLIRSDRDENAAELENLPPTAVRALVSKACRTLQIKTPQALVPALTKLKRVVDAASGMQRFISAVVSLTHPPKPGVEKSADPDLTDAIRILRMWKHLAASVKRPVEVNLAVASKRDEGTKRVESENEDAIARHFMQVFRVSEASAATRKIDEIFDFMQETVSFYKALQSLLHPDGLSRMTARQMLRHIRDLVRRNDASSSSQRARPKEPENVVVSKETASSKFLGVRRVREMHDALETMKKLCGVSTTDALIEKCRLRLGSKHGA
eukprot:g2229.t1